MQDDQTKSVDSDLSLSGKPPLNADTPTDDQKQSDSSISDPAQEALKQSEQTKDIKSSTDSSSSKTKEDSATSTPVEGEPPTPPADSQPDPPADTNATGSPPTTSTDITSDASPQDDSTLDPIKKEALQKLEPLVSELDLHPEEKYRALMMIIQATDNKDLVNEAYQAADKIEDNKTRAQALLSIVNEIEYFKNKEIASSNQ